MTVLKLGQPRRNPLGRHRCYSCHAVLELDKADLEKALVHAGDLWWPCPCCNSQLKLNGIGDVEPPMPPPP